MDVDTIISAVNFLFSVMLNKTRRRQKKFHLGLYMECSSDILSLACAANEFRAMQRTNTARGESLPIAMPLP